jgi:hypothetical protein
VSEPLPSPLLSDEIYHHHDREQKKKLNVSGGVRVSKFGVFSLMDWLGLAILLACDCWHIHVKIDDVS